MRVKFAEKFDSIRNTVERTGHPRPWGYRTPASVFFLPIDYPIGIAIELSLIAYACLTGVYALKV